MPNALDVQFEELCRLLNKRSAHQLTMQYHAVQMQHDPKNESECVRFERSAAEVASAERAIFTLLESAHWREAITPHLHPTSERRVRAAREHRHGA